MFSHLYPESYTPFSSPYFPRSTATRKSSLSFLLWVQICHKGNNCCPYSLFIFIFLTEQNFYLQLNSGHYISIIKARSSPLKFCDRVCTQSRTLNEDILASLDQEKCGLKLVYNFLGEDEKTQRNLYLLLLKTSLWKEVRHFFRTLYPNKNHVTTHHGVYSCVLCFFQLG